MKQKLCHLNSSLIVYSTIFSPKDLVEKYANKSGLNEVGSALASLCPTLGGSGATVFYGELIPR